MTNTIYPARKIITMNPARPHAGHVAVRDGRIVGAGTLDELAGWGAYTLDDRFADKVLMPGLVEGHSHTMEGTLWAYVYCGFFDRMDPEGTVWPGLKSIDEIVERLSEAAGRLEDPGRPLAGWSLDAIYYGNRRVNRHDLDRVSTERPVGVLNASGHILNVNSKALELAGLLKTGLDHPGIPLGEDGLPTGEMKGPDAMAPLGPYTGFDRDLLSCDEPGLRRFARLCVRTGVTTAADLANTLPDEAVDMMLRVTAEPDFPARIVSLRRFYGVTPEELIAHVLALRDRSHDNLRLGIIKAVADGSIRASRRGCAGRVITTERRKVCGTSRRSICWKSTSAPWRPACRSTPIPTVTRQRSWRSIASRRRCASIRRPTIASRCSIARWPTRPSSAAWPGSACA